MRSKPSFSSLTARARQGGMIATLIALVVLVATLLAATALMRSVDTANSIAGSMSFRQAAMQEGERAYQDIRVKFVNTLTPPTSNDDHADVGYYASLQPRNSVRHDLPDILVQATTDSTVVGKVDAGVTGNKVFYVVERLCPGTGNADPNTCIVPGTAISGGTSSNSTTDPGIPFNTSGSAAAFRLTVRVDGPRNAHAYIQTILR